MQNRWVLCLIPLKTPPLISPHLPPPRRAKIPDEVRLKGPAVVKATIEIYNTIRSELLPTPAKSHYTYNMRDLSKVLQVGQDDFAWSCFKIRGALLSWRATRFSLP